MSDIITRIREERARCKAYRVVRDVYGVRYYLNAVSWANKPMCEGLLKEHTFKWHPSRGIVFIDNDEYKNSGMRPHVKFLLARGCRLEEANDSW